MDTTSKIIHVDMDAFFASVEQRDFPAYKGKPLAVGGTSERGVVAAASYEARKFGVYSAMPSAIAKRKCPDLIFTKPRFEVYKAVSHQVREIFFEYTDLVEPLSLDEAYLDVTHNKKKIPSAVLLAKEIKKAILDATDLTASAGVSYNKFLAKTASAIQKPDGLTLIHPDRALAFIEKLPIEKFHGIGKVTADKMKRLNIFNGRSLKQQELETLVRHFGKTGRYYYNICRGIDPRVVNPHRIRKSVGAENTFFKDLFTHQELLEAMQRILEKVDFRAEKASVYPKTVTLKIKYSDFEIVSRSKTKVAPIISKEEAVKILLELLSEFDPPPKGVRLLGVSYSNFATPGGQLTIDF